MVTNHLRIQGRDEALESSDEAQARADTVRSWLAALLGAEHVSLLVGSGLSIALSLTAGASPLSMSALDLTVDGAEAINKHATQSADRTGRGEANLEDQLRSALQVLGGLQVVEPDAVRTTSLQKALETGLSAFASKGLLAEREIRAAMNAQSERGRRAAYLLASFLLAFASRPPSRERLGIFTTNYDRLIELGADLAGIRVIDRFVGAVEPVFRSSRLEVDLHYNPPGIRGEPRYLEGVVRLTKLHGSLDWRWENRTLRRIPLSFGGADPDLDDEPLDRLMIYPNAAKDFETALYPYAELFRDFSAAVCRPNGALVTYGYGFGDDHINRVVRDMLTLRSTHLLIISRDDPGGRIARFVAESAPDQVSLLIGENLGDLGALVDHYLPSTAPDDILARQTNRSRVIGASAASTAAGEPE